MKRLICEMCGSADLLKQDGVFICQTCGCRYSVEEARRIMVDGTVNVSGSTIKIDVSDELRNLYQIARRARDDNNSENAARYYDMILIKDPLSWEASFYLVYFRAIQCKIAEIQSAGIAITNCIDTVFNLIRTYVSDQKEQEIAVKEVATRCIHISSVLYAAARKHYNGISESIRLRYVSEVMRNCMTAWGIAYRLGDCIDVMFEDHESLKAVAVEAWKAGIQQNYDLITYFDNMKEQKAIIAKYESKIKKYNSDYQAPKAGCYVASCVYGSYDCSQVWTLRRYRDYTLAETWYGRTFIHIYYAVSPTLVKYFGHANWFKKMWKPLLDNMVDRLNRDGFADTPYNDRRW